MSETRSAIEELTEELEGKNRRIDELEALLNTQTLGGSLYRLQATHLPRAFQRAQIRSWFWVAETRLTHYWPTAGDAGGPPGGATGEAPVSEDLLLGALHPAERERVAQTWNRAHASRAPYDIDYRVVAKDGSLRHQQESATAAFDDSDRYLGFVGITQDISRQKLVEAELTQSTNNLSEAERIAKIGHWKWDEEGYRLLSCSQESAAIFGLSVDEFMAGSGSHEGYLQLVFVDDRKVVDEAVRAFYQEFRANPARGNSFELEYRIVRADGSIRAVRERAGTARDELGRVLRSVGTIQDITEQKAAEAALRVRDAWLRGILQNAPIEIVLKDREGCILAISDKVLGVPDHQGEKSLGKTSDDFLPPAIAKVYRDADRKVLQSGEALQQEVEEEIDGRPHHLLNEKFPLTDEAGAVVGVCSLTSDITHLKQMQSQLHQAQKLLSVGQLSAGVAHDFNNILAIILGNAEMLSERSEGEEPLLESILRASERGALLTHRLLAFSRQQPLAPCPVDLANLAAGMSEMLTRSLSETIEINMSAAPGLWTASADPGQVENVLLNLTLNARDAMPDGGKLTICCANTRLDEDYAADNPDTKPGDYVVLEVSDEGTGMTAEVQAQAFEPFFTTKAVGKGSGLGLSMVYGFARQSGGHVAIQSEEGLGTTVEVYLPRAGEAVGRKEVRPQKEVPRGGGELILLIEDDPEVRALAVRILRDLGYQVIDVCDADAAHQALSKAKLVELVLSDVVLPGGISGPEFAEQARRTYPDLKIIFMSGYPAEAARRNGLLGSEHVLLNKPFQKLQLANALRDALG